MEEYAFPGDLLEGIKSRWELIPDNTFKLPRDDVLRRLLETCYHASLRTSEQRKVHCVVAYASVEDVPEGALQLANPPVLTDAELVRLAPVTSYRQTVIGCDAREGWLRIWGFFEYGHTWVQHSSGDPPDVPMQLADLPPDCLTITIEGPGALTIARGRTALVRLQAGKIIFPQETLFQSDKNPLGLFFHSVISDLCSSSGNLIKTRWNDSSFGQRSLLNIYTTSILAILERIRLRQHGGSVVIARAPLPEELAHMTYTVSEHVGLASEIIDYKALDDVLRIAASELNTTTELEHCRTEVLLSERSRKLIRGISQISLLAAVDGAVLLDQQLRIQGFGVRFPILLPPGTMVLNSLTGREYPCDQWGLRHQSVFSLCQKCEQLIGLIVSQDGEVKAVKAEGGRIMFWDGILD